jgi:hypothetical protein
VTLAVIDRPGPWLRRSLRHLKDFLRLRPLLERGTLTGATPFQAVLA